MPWHSSLKAFLRGERAGVRPWSRDLTVAIPCSAMLRRSVLLGRRGVAGELLGDLGGFFGAADALEERDRLLELGRGVLALALQQIGLQARGARLVGGVVLGGRQHISAVGVL